MPSMKTALVAVSVAIAPLTMAGLSYPQDTGADVAMFDRYIEALRQQARIPGLSGIVVRDGRTVWLRGAGLQDVDAHVPATPDTPHETASLTKTFTSTLLMQCVERGTLTLDTPISRYSSAIPEPGATVRHV